MMIACVLVGIFAFSSSSFAQTCVVADPTGTPLNVRATPGGSVVATIANGTWVVVQEYRGQWVHIAHSSSGHPIGWVFRRYLNCG